MTGGSSGEYTFLLAIDRPSLVRQVERKLQEAGVPFQTGLVSEPKPRVLFLVPRSRLSQARALLKGGVGGHELPFGTSTSEKRPLSLPWGPIQTVLAVVLLHLSLVFALTGSNPTLETFVLAGGLAANLVGSEPWRLLTSLFLHVDPSHVFWNGLSMMIFAVPLILELGYLRVGGVYLVGGIGGGLAALLTAGSGDVMIGSSGAVAGLFGTWAVLTFLKARRASLSRRSLIRVMGLALLVLPSLLSPTSSTGHTISVESHLGGLVLGLVAGVLLAWLDPRDRTEDEPSTEDEEP